MAKVVTIIAVLITIIELILIRGTKMKTNKTKMIIVITIITTIIYVHV